MSALGLFLALFILQALGVLGFHVLKGGGER